MLDGYPILRRAIDVFEYAARQTLLRHLPKVFDTVGTQISVIHDGLQYSLGEQARAFVVNAKEETYAWATPWVPVSLLANLPPLGLPPLPVVASSLLGCR